MKKPLSCTLRKLAHSSLFAILLVSSLQHSVAHAQVKPGSLVVLDALGLNLKGALYLIDPDGRRTILSRLQDDTQGPKTSASGDITVASSGFIYMTSDTLIFEINPLTGNRTTVTDLTNSDQGVVGTAFLAVAVDSMGQIYATASVMTSQPPPNDVANVLFRIDPETGDRVVLSHFDDDTEGETVKPGTRMQLESDTSLLVLGNNRKIVRVNLTDGTRSLVIGTGVFLSNWTGFAVEPSGNLLLTSSTSKLLYRVLTSETTSGPLGCPPPEDHSGGICGISDFGNAEQGPLGRLLWDVAVDASGEIFVVDKNFGADRGLVHKGGVFKVDAQTGQRLILSDFADDTQGPPGFAPSAIALAIPVTPTPEDILLARAVAVATESLRVQKNAMVKSGNLITNGSTGNALINKGATTPEQFEVAANALIIKKKAVVGGDVVADNFFKNQGTVKGKKTIAVFPVLHLPPFQEAVTGDARVLVNKGGFLSLPEGRFKSIILKKGATLALEGGIYETETLKTAKGAKIVYDAPFELRMSMGATFGKSSVVRPADGSALNAKDAVFYPAVSFKTGKSSKIEANIVGPNSDCNFGKSSQLTGSAYCRDVTLGKSSRVTLMNFLEDSIVAGE